MQSFYYQYFYSESLKDLFGYRMTKKGIIKLGTSTETSYHKIEQFILVNIHIAVNTLYYHLSEIKVTDQIIIELIQQSIKTYIYCN